MFRLDVLQDGHQLIVQDPAKVLIFIDLPQLQGAHVQIVFICCILLFQHLPGRFQTSIEVLNVCADISVHIDLQIGHEPLKILMHDQLAQQPMIEFSIP